MKVFCESLGCPKNTADSEYMLGILKLYGCNIVNSPYDADVIMVNTCGFIQPAKEESIEAIFDLAQIKEQEPDKKLVVCGCLYERYKQEFMKELPEVDAFLGVHELDRISEIIFGKRLHLDRPYLSRYLITPSHVSYLKIADGCSNKCTFCAIPLIKSGFKSREIDELVEEARSLVKRGVKELNIVAQDTTAYMFDRGLKNQLVELLKRLESIDGLKWIRLLYTYPSFITDELIECISDSEKIVHYLDVPFQHVSDKVLEGMGRGYKRSDVDNLVDKLRMKIPDIAIRSTFIVGFPTETDKDFEQLLDFLESTRLDWSAFFTYFHEEGTVSFNRYKDLDVTVKQQRIAEAEKLAAQIEEENNLKLIDKEFEVVIDKRSDEYDGFYEARSYRSAYEIDGIVLVKGRELKSGEFIRVRIYGISTHSDLLAVEV